MAGVLPEADVSFEFEQPAKAMLGVTIRVMRAEILLGSVFGMLTRFPLSSCRRACGGTHDASADSYGESRQLPLLRESTGLSLKGITVARQCRIYTDFAHCGGPRIESDSRQSHTNTMHMGLVAGVGMWMSLKSASVLFLTPPN